MCYLPLFHSAKKLNERNVLNVLHEAQFADDDWEQLSQQLIEHVPVATIRANRPGQANLCRIDTISQWLRTDSEASWEKLAEAVVKVG